MYTHTYTYIHTVNMINEAKKPDLVMSGPGGDNHAYKLGSNKKYACAHILIHTYIHTYIQ